MFSSIKTLFFFSSVSKLSLLLTAISSSQQPPSRCSNAFSKIPTLLPIILTSNALTLPNLPTNAKTSTASCPFTYSPEHHHHMEPNRSILSVRAWTASIGEYCSILTGVLICSVLNSHGESSERKCREVLQRCRMGVSQGARVSERWVQINRRMS